LNIENFDVALPRDPSAGAVARRELRRRFAGVLPERVLDDLRLVVSELVTNAVLHGDGAIRLRLRVDAGAVWGEVIDAGSGFEHELREVGPSATSGRGLLIVDQLTARWACMRAPPTSGSRCPRPNKSASARDPM